MALTQMIEIIFACVAGGAFGMWLASLRIKKTRSRRWLLDAISEYLFTLFFTYCIWGQLMMKDTGVDVETSDRWWALFWAVLAIFSAKRAEKKRWVWSQLRIAEREAAKTGAKITEVKVR